MEDEGGDDHSNPDDIEDDNDRNNGITDNDLAADKVCSEHEASYENRVNLQPTTKMPIMISQSHDGNSSESDDLDGKAAAACSCHRLMRSTTSWRS